MIQLEDIIECYFRLRKNKRNTADQVEFELHWEASCVKLYEDIVNRSMQPTAYTFIVYRPKMREIFASDLQTRILHYYIDERIRPILERIMTQKTFNNRKGMGQIACQNAVISDIYEASNGFTRDCWIVGLDLKGCFPNIVQDIAYRQLRKAVEDHYHGDDKDDLLWILSRCVFSFATDHCYRKSKLYEWADYPKEKSMFHKPPGIGACIGHLLWQIATNYYFHEIDLWCVENFRWYNRYVDDMKIVITSKTALLLIPELRRRLSDLGATLNERKFYCQHYTKGTDCLGVHIKMDRIYPNNRIVYRAKQSMLRFNRKPREEQIEKFLSSMNSYFGVMKGTNGYARLRDVLDLMNPAWLEYVEWNKNRLCLQAKPEYSERNRIINKFNLIKNQHETRRKRPAHPCAGRGTTESFGSHAPKRRPCQQVYQARVGISRYLPAGV